MQLPCVSQDLSDYSVTLTMLIVVIPGSRKGIRDTLLGGRVLYILSKVDEECVWWD